jgi:hypothetical protein
MVPMTSKLTNGSEELIGIKFFKEKYLLHGYLKFAILQTHNILIDMLSLLRLQACQLKSSNDTLQTSEKSVEKIQVGIYYKPPYCTNQKL